MAQAPLPVELAMVSKLTVAPTNIRPESINYTSVSLSSTRHLLVHEQVPGQPNSIVIMDLTNPSQPDRRPTGADAHLIHPVARVLLLRVFRNGKTKIQVYNLTEGTKITDITLPFQVEYWKWISRTDVAVVTADAVYRVPMSSSGTPTKMFDRDAGLAGLRIVSIEVSPDGTWVALTGTSAGVQAGPVTNKIQLFSSERGRSQVVPAHRAVFAMVDIDGAPSLCFVFAARDYNTQAVQLRLIQLGKQVKKQLEVSCLGTPDDYPMVLLFAPKFSVLYMVTSGGTFYMVDVLGWRPLFQRQVTQAHDALFTGIVDENGDHAAFVSLDGRVLRIGLNERGMVPYLVSTAGREYAMQFAQRAPLQGAEAMFREQFEAAIQRREFKEAAQIAATTASGVLRTVETLRRFEQASHELARVNPQAPPPILHYFQLLMATGKLNADESLALARHVLAQRSIGHLRKWIEEDKVTCSEGLGDLVRNDDPTLALGVYLRANAHGKVSELYVTLGQLDQLFSYCERARYTPNWEEIFASVIDRQRDQATKLAVRLGKTGRNPGQPVSPENPPMLGPMLVVTALASRHMSNELILYLLDVLTNAEGEDKLQTLMLRTALLTNVGLADQILERKLHTRFDHTAIAQLCEERLLVQQALRLTTDEAHIKRLVVHTGRMTGQFLVDYFGTLSDEFKLECLSHMLKHNLESNLPVCVNIATQYHESLGLKPLIKLFRDDFRSPQGVFFFLGQVISNSQDPEVHFAYIQSSLHIGRLDEVERVCRESQIYDPAAVRDLLVEARVDPPKALIVVCSQHDLVEDLTAYLYDTRQKAYIHAFVNNINPLALPRVLHVLLTRGSDVEFIKQLIDAVGAKAPVGPLVEVIGRHNALKVLRGWLDARASEGSEDPELYNAIAQLRIETNSNPEAFLQSNPFYDSRVVGRYCERREPQLALIAYERGGCDSDYLRVACKNSLFKPLARYLVKRKDQELWVRVLMGPALPIAYGFLPDPDAPEGEDEDKDKDKDEDKGSGPGPAAGTGDSGDDKSDVSGGLLGGSEPDHSPAGSGELAPGELTSEQEETVSRARAQIIEHTTATALPASHSTEEVTSCVQAFMDAELPQHLIGLLEKLVFENSEFGEVGQLQNLLIVTAIKLFAADQGDRSRITAYIERLTKLDPDFVAKHARAAELYAEAFLVYKRAKRFKEAVQVLVEDMNDMDTAVSLATQLDQQDVWSMLATAQLGRMDSADALGLAVTSLMRAKDYEQHVLVIQHAKAFGGYAPLVTYLEFCKSGGVEDASVDTELLEAYARTDNQAALQDMLASRHFGRVQEVAHRCYDAHLYEAARILYASVPNHARLASTLVQLGQFAAAFEAAQQSNTIACWKEVCFACLDHREFRLAHQCGLRILTTSDDLDDIVEYYETRGYVDHLETLLQAGISSEAATARLFTELALQHSKYRPTKLLGFIQNHKERLTIPRVLNMVLVQHQWKEAVLLYLTDEDFDKALRLMVEHPVTAWEHAQFKRVFSRAGTSSLVYDAVEHYVQFHPDFINDLLEVLPQRTDLVRVVKIARDRSCLALIRQYLESVQTTDSEVVNEALHEIYLEELDFDALRRSVEAYTSYDAIALANQLQRHALFEFRRIATLLYTRAHRWVDAMSISKADRLFADLVETAATSKDSALVHETLEWLLVEARDPEAFSAALFVCYDHVHPSDVLELAWRHKALEYAVPFFVQQATTVLQRLGEFDERLAELHRSVVGEVDEVDEVPPDIAQDVAVSLTTEAVTGMTSQALTIQLTGQVAPGGAGHVGAGPMGPTAVLTGVSRHGVGSSPGVGPGAYGGYAGPHPGGMRGPMAGMQRPGMPAIILSGARRPGR